MKVTVIEIKHYHLKNILINIAHIINNPKKSDIEKLQLTKANNIVSAIDFDEECVMH